MTTYVVNHTSSIDCYKRAESSTRVVYTGANQDEAYAAAINCWIDLWNDRADYYIEDGDPAPYGEKLLKMLPEEGELFTIESLSALHNFFCSNAWDIWTPDYINCPIEQIEIKVMNKGPSKKVIVDIELINTARMLCMSGPDREGLEE
tara:strand:+ start:117 stop:560 length:444 start_codon:yes stop_codon:yes gene_type:complete